MPTSKSRLKALRSAAHHIGILSGALTMALASCGVLPNPVFAQEKAAPRSIKARDFMSTFGVNVHFGQNNYRNTQAIADALNIIGLSRVRSSCVSAEEVAAWKDLAVKTAPYFSAGLKANVLINGYLNAPNVTLASQQVLVPQIADIIESIEGPNEINNYSVGDGTHGPSDNIDRTKDFSSNSLAWARALFEWRKGAPVLANAKLIAPNIASGDSEDYAKLPNVSQYVDAGNLHFYAGNGRQPSGFGGGNFSAIHDWYQATAAPGKTSALSEWGQTTASKPGQGGSDEATQARYILNQMFDATSKGVYRAYLYQLMDDSSDGDPTGNGGTESHFGIFDHQWRAKPAAQALANLKNLLTDTSTGFTAQPLAYSVSGVSNAGASGSSLSIRKSDGSAFIAVWNEPPIWDSKTNTPIAPPPNQVTVNFGGGYSYEVYNPLLGLDAIAAGQGSTIRVKVPGSPILIQIRK